MDISFGQWMRAAREAKGMQQKEVARILGVSAQFVNDVEHDRRNPPDPARTMFWAETIGLDRQRALVRAAWAHETVSHWLMYMEGAPNIVDEERATAPDPYAINEEAKFRDRERLKASGVVPIMPKEEQG
jgi:transcriptional regulator with XRE-family HTH domain